MHLVKPATKGEGSQLQILSDREGERTLPSAPLPPSRERAGMILPPCMMPVRALHPHPAGPGAGCRHFFQSGAAGADHGRPHLLQWLGEPALPPSLLGTVPCICLWLDERARDVGSCCMCVWRWWWGVGGALVDAQLGRSAPLLPPPPCIHFLPLFFTVLRCRLKRSASSLPPLAHRWAT